MCTPAFDISRLTVSRAIVSEDRPVIPLCKAFSYSIQFVPKCRTGDRAKLTSARLIDYCATPPRLRIPNTRFWGSYLMFVKLNDKDLDLASSMRASSTRRTRITDQLVRGVSEG
jgi:hypothetical protein